MAAPAARSHEVRRHPQPQQPARAPAARAQGPRRRGPGAGRGAQAAGGGGRPRASRSWRWPRPRRDRERCRRCAARGVWALAPDIAGLALRDRDEPGRARHRRAGRRSRRTRFFRGPALVLVAVGVQNPGNLGALLRTAEAAGATGAYLTDGSADPFSWKALRGSMGSAFRLPHVPARRRVRRAGPARSARPARRGRGRATAARTTPWTCAGPSPSCSAPRARACRPRSSGARAVRMARAHARPRREPERRRGRGRPAVRGRAAAADDGADGVRLQRPRSGCS